MIEFIIPHNAVSGLDDLLDNISKRIKKRIDDAPHNVELHGINREPFKIEILHPKEAGNGYDVHTVQITYSASLPKKIKVKNNTFQMSKE